MYVYVCMYIYNARALRGKRSVGALFFRGTSPLATTCVDVYMCMCVYIYIYIYT